ncbi:DUF1488 domain-containing protein [Ancylobacter sp. Lp-2]|uniref:DUF1488 family protein n=1 Tax=Ancylobacter sp. Lp-2 TaxID=2881339 RepID=UPI001E53AE65|nr:DUF1488 family protein [Ancylobacter sp. Lp-2]MCB4767833.1 DUF1488 domain-containing protein [Ancylobacter sp. Lp-2]
MILDHSAKPAEDLEDVQKIRFFFRGDTDVVPCLVTWEALDRLEGGKAADRAERLERFEKHRSAIEVAARRKAVNANGIVTVNADETVQAAKGE